MFRQSPQRVVPLHLPQPAQTPAPCKGNATGTLQHQSVAMCRQWQLPVLRKQPQTARQHWQYGLSVPRHPKAELFSGYQNKSHSRACCGVLDYSCSWIGAESRQVSQE